MKMLHYLLAAIACGGSLAAAAQSNYPTKPIRLIVGFAPGGNTDTVARIVGGKLGERLNGQIVVDNRGGAGGAIGTALAARANPDGYTMTMGTTTTHAIAVAAYSRLPYDPVKDFDPIAQVAIAPYMLVVPAQSPARDLKSFITYVKSQPGKLNYGSAGQATTTHLVMATLTQRAGLEMAHIPFKGNGPATTAVLSDEVQALFGALPPLLGHVKAGRLRPLAVSSGQRVPSAPDVPTVAESGFPGFNMALWLGFFTPKGTPRAILKKLEADLLQVAQAADTKEAMSRQGLQAQGAGSAELAQLLKADIENYKKVFKAAGLKMQ